MTALAFVAAALAVIGAASLVPERRAPRRRRAGGWIELLAAAGARVRPGALRPPSDLSARLAAAGAPSSLGPSEFMAAKLVAAALAAPVGLIATGALPGRLDVLAVPAAPVAGFLAPEWWLARRVTERLGRVRRELPAMLDLLRVTADAGVGLAPALEAVGRRTAGPLGAEWRTVAREVALGAPLEHALAGMRTRLPLPEVRALVAALERAVRHGSPLSEALLSQAREARLAEGRRLQEHAARAGPKIQLVVALLLVPSVLLLVAAALLAALVGDGGTVSLG